MKFFSWLSRDICKSFAAFLYFKLFMYLAHRFSSNPQNIRGTLFGKHEIHRFSREINNTLYNTRKKNQFSVFRSFLWSFTLAIHKFIHPVCLPSTLLKYSVGTRYVSSALLTLRQKWGTLGRVQYLAVQLLLRIVLCLPICNSGSDRKWGGSRQRSPPEQQRSLDEQHSASF